jgi:OOP family OmpA-OmpF porin
MKPVSSASFLKRTALIPLIILISAVSFAQSAATAHYKGAVFFGGGEYKLDQAKELAIEPIIERIPRSGKYSLILIGHTDSTGNAASNFAISKKRVAAVKAYLIKRGAKASYIRTSYKGSEKPLYSNETEDGRNKNRRVDIYLYGFKEKPVKGTK